MTGLLGRLKTLAAVVGLWTARAVERRELAELDEHRLRDLGLTRQQTRDESRRPFWSGEDRARVRPVTGAADRDIAAEGGGRAVNAAR
jgi:uncharacterized protein YjiS (DUF1127 family)